MRWQGRRGSQNVQDRRGISPVAAGGGIGAVVIALLVMLLGGDPGEVIQGGAPAASGPPTAAEDSLARFVSVVLADTEEGWQTIFQEDFGQAYREPTLVLFSGSVQSACGFAQAAMGPFYCPLDEHVYIDLSFYRDLRDRMGAPGDFAQAYVIAHEVGHHVHDDRRNRRAFEPARKVGKYREKRVGNAVRHARRGKAAAIYAESRVFRLLVARNLRVSRRPA